MLSICSSAAGVRLRFWRGVRADQREGGRVNRFAKISRRPSLGVRRGRAALRGIQDARVPAESRKEGGTFTHVMQMLLD